MTGTLASAVRELVDNRLAHVDEDTVATALAAAIVNSDQFDAQPREAIEAGVAAAIDEIDDTTLDAAFEVIQEAVNEEIERQATAIATRLIRKLAATAARETTAT